jgi:hypothetical protein
MPKYIVTYPIEIEAKTPEEAAQQAREILQEQCFDPYLEVVEQDKDKNIDAHHAFDFHTGRKFRKRNVRKCPKCQKESYTERVCFDCSEAMPIHKSEWYEV